MTTDQRISLNGVNLRYRDTGGPGVPVLLSHGIGASLEFWAPQLERLAGQLRLIAWDAPNHGLSDLTKRAEDFDSYAGWGLKLADALGLQRFAAVGNSMGAAVSLRMAGLAPQRVAGVLLANPAAMGPEVTPVFRLFTLPLLGEVMNKPSARSVDLQIKALVLDPSCVGPDLRQVIARNVAKPGGAAAFLASLRATSGWRGQRQAVWMRSRALMAGLTCPALVLHGRQDTVLPYHQAELAATLSPLASLLLLEACGHTPQIEQPERFNAALTRFVAALT